MDTNRIRIVLMFFVAASLVAFFGFGTASAAIQVTTPTATAIKTAVSAVAVTATITPTVAAPSATPKAATATVVAPTATKPVTSSAPTATKVVTSAVATATKVTAATITPTKTIVVSATVTPTKAVTATVTRTPTVAPTVAVRSPRAGSISTISTVFVLQNMDAYSQATVNATFYDTTGTVISSLNKTAAPYANVTYDQRSGGGLDSITTFQGSVVVSATTQLAAVAALYSGNSTTLQKDFRLDVYNGTSSSNASTVHVLPQLVKNSEDLAQGRTFNSSIAIQNTDASNVANVTLVLTNNAHPYWGGGVYTKTRVIPVGASAFIQLEQESLAATNRFYGSGIITSDRPVAVIQSQNAAGALQNYEGFTETRMAGTRLSVPQLVKNIVDTTGLTFQIGIEVSTTDGSSQTVRVTYTNLWNGRSVARTQTGTQMSFDLRSDPVLIAPYTTTPYCNASLPSCFYGSAIVECTSCTGSTKIYVLVNQATDAHATLGTRQATDVIFPDTGGKTIAYTPLIMKYYYDAGTDTYLSTGIVGRLVGTGPATVTVSYSNGASKVLTNVTSLFDVDQRSDAGLVSGFYGAARITSTVPFLVKVNVSASSNSSGSASPGDGAGAYAGISSTE